MAVKLSKMYGMDIYTASGSHLGKVNDIILNMEKGCVVRLTTEPLTSVTKTGAEQILKNKSVLFKNVHSVGDILIVGRKAPEDIEEGPVQSKVTSRSEKIRIKRPKYY